MRVHCIAEVLGLFVSHSILSVTMYYHKQKRQIFISHYIYIRLEYFTKIAKVKSRRKKLIT